MTLILNILYHPVVYTLSLLYCIWRFKKRSDRTSLDGVIGTSPGLETVAAVILAPILAIGDLVVTGIKKAFKNKQK